MTRDLISNTNSPQITTRLLAQNENETKILLATNDAPKRPRIVNKKKSKMGETRQPKASTENPDKEVKVAEWADTQVDLMVGTNG